MSFSERSLASLIVASEVLYPGITSTSFITGAGLKKCIPTTLSGLFVTDAISVIERDEVFVASTTSGLQILSSSAKRSFLVFMFSAAASMM